jgi:hypothetical protein
VNGKQAIELVSGLRALAPPRFLERILAFFPSQPTWREIAKSSQRKRALACTRWETKGLARVAGADANTAPAIHFLMPAPSATRLPKSFINSGAESVVRARFDANPSD